MKKANTGFSLIELVTGVVIVGILAAIAIPAYMEQMRKVRRTDAMTALEICANAMERLYTQQFTYIGAGTVTNIDGTNAVGPPDPLICPAATDYYAIVINAGVTATTFTLRATPIAGSRQDGDGFLELTESGAERWDEDNNGVIDTDLGPPPFDNNNWTAERP